MKYLIQRIEDGKFVAPPGKDKSYTRDILTARIFDSHKEAERERCGNERIVSLDHAVQTR